MERKWKTGGWRPVVIDTRADFTSLWELYQTERERGINSKRALRDALDAFPGSPLVVIDPEDMEATDRLADLLEHHGWGPVETDTLRVVDSGANVADALREFANPTPPKPEEPTGHLAVVVDTEGRRWVNWRDPRDPMEHDCPWVLAHDSEICRNWGELDVSPDGVIWEGVAQ